MPVEKSRRRVELPADVYAMLAREARWLHVPTATLATIILSDNLRRSDRNLAHPQGPTVPAGPGITTFWDGPPRPPFGRDAGVDLAEGSADPIAAIVLDRMDLEDRMAAALPMHRPAAE